MLCNRVIVTFGSLACFVILRQSFVYPRLPSDSVHNKGDFKLLVLMSTVQLCSTTSTLYSFCDSTQGFMNARLTFHQMSYISSQGNGNLTV